MFPKKNLGAVGVMSAFLGLTATHIITFIIYILCFRNGGYTDGFETAVTLVGIAEMLLYFALTGFFGLLFVYSDDGYSAASLIFSALISILALSARFSIVSSNTEIFRMLSFIINLSILGLFAVYAVKLKKHGMKQLSVTALCSGAWLSFIYIGFKSLAENNLSEQRVFILYGLTALISAFCYGVGYYSQRQTFEPYVED
ncbi:MAG: hypothetical protein MJ081_02975 [Ruminococcus sp.]|nr:hypothetical protein [Ruminococcus sp.]